MRSVEPSPHARSTTEMDERPAAHVATASSTAPLRALLVVRLAQRQPARWKIRSYGPLDRQLRTASPIPPGWQLPGGRTRSGGEPSRARPDVQATGRKHRGQRRIARRHQHARLRRHRIGDGAAVVPIDRQSVRDRLARRPCRSPRSATAARTDRTPRKVHVNTRIRRRVLDGDARGQTGLSSMSLLRRAVVAGSRLQSPTMVRRHGKSMSSASASISTS